MPAPLTNASAVVATLEFIEKEGRIPVWTDFVASNGLPHWRTLCYRGGIKLFISGACAIQNAGWSGGCSAWMQDIPWGSGTMTVSLDLSGSYRPCLRCNRSIPKEGPHIRHCPRCRERLFAGKYNDTPGVIDRTVAKVAGIEGADLASPQSWEDLLDEAMSHPHANGIPRNRYYPGTYKRR